MGRELKRVPMDFDYPIGKVWYGYYDRSYDFCHSGYSAGCDGCKAYAKIKGIQLDDIGCPKFREFYGLPEIGNLVEPPVGEGYQLWETTTEGSPSSPVFATIEELCSWCEKNATTFANFKASKEEWMKMLNRNMVCHQEGNIIFI